MNKTAVSWVAVAAVAIGGALLLKANAPVSQEQSAASLATPSALAAATSSFEFGSISMANGRVFTVFHVRNTSSSTVTITKVYTSCMCTTAMLAVRGVALGPFGMPGHLPVPVLHETLAGGETVPVTVIFDPAAHGPAGVGRIERTVYVETAGARPFELNISATVTP